MEKILLIDGDQETTMKEFIDANMDDNVEPLTAEEFNNVINLDVGDEIMVGICWVKRIK